MDMISQLLTLAEHPGMAGGEVTDNEDCGDDNEEHTQLPAVSPLLPEFAGYSVKQVAPVAWSTGALVGATIAVRWPDNDGSWLLGEVSKQRGRKQGKHGQYKQYPFNYEVSYPVDGTVVHHALNDRTYNPSANAPRNAWVHLVHE
jgi:hypothetical protein